MSSDFGLDYDCILPIALTIPTANSGKLSSRVMKRGCWVSRFVLRAQKYKISHHNLSTSWAAESIFDEAPLREDDGGILR